MLKHYNVIAIITMNLKLAKCHGVGVVVVVHPLLV